MFLRVTDFYSLEKIKSAFPKIVLLYLKHGWRVKKRAGGPGEKEFVQEREREGAVPRHQQHRAEQGVAGEQGGGGWEDGDHMRKIKVHSSQVCLTALETVSS